MKSESHTINAVPSKRLYRSIIADYGINTSVSELIDNIVDARTRKRLKRIVDVRLNVDVDSQTIELSDNGGGIRETELEKLVSQVAVIRMADPNRLGFSVLVQKGLQLRLPGMSKSKPDTADRRRHFRLNTMKLGYRKMIGIYPSTPSLRFLKALHRFLSRNFALS